MKVLLFSLILASLALTHTSESLRARYGAPVAEVFEIRRDVRGTVTYDPGGRVSAILVEPSPQWLGAGKLDEDSTVLSTSQIMDVFNELAPSDSRGRLLEGPRLGHHSWQYEKVSLFLAGKEDAWLRARIVFGATLTPAAAQPN